MAVYEMMRTAIDPFDLACSDCELHEIQWFEKITEEELREAHAYELDLDKYMPDFQKDILIAEGNWYPTHESFDEWLKDNIDKGYIRVKAEEGTIL